MTHIANSGRRVASRAGRLASFILNEALNRPAGFDPKRTLWILCAVVALLAHIAAVIGQLAALWHWFGFPPMLL